MNSQEIEKKVIELLIDKLEISSTQITIDSSFKDLGADSLDQVEIIMELEEIFGITFPDDIHSEDLNLKSLCRYIEKNT
jgi:acyl carrier protein